MVSGRTGLHPVLLWVFFGLWQVATLVSTSRFVSHPFDDPSLMPQAADEQKSDVIDRSFPRIVMLFDLSFNTTTTTTSRRHNKNDDNNNNEPSATTLLARKEVPPHHNVLDDKSVSSEEEDEEIMGRLMPNQDTEEYQRDCVPMKEWQTLSFPNCNAIHEIALAPSLELLDSGGWRWAATHEQLGKDHAIWKLFGLEDGLAFDREAHEIHRIDAMISERLTFSPFVVDIYGYCGTTTIYERAKGTLRDIVVGSKKHPKNLSLDVKFQYSYQLAQALADIHGFDYVLGNNATVAHRDMKEQNVLISNTGVAKLNDFNDALTRNWNATAGDRQCPYYYKGFPLEWGVGYKPVEMASTDRVPLDDKVDVFGLGGLFYLIVAGDRPYGDYPDKKSGNQAMYEGKPPTIPSKYLPEKDQPPKLQLLLQLIRECMALDPSQRPTAKSVRDRMAPLAESSQIAD